MFEQNRFAGVVQWLESQPSKLVVWVRFPSPAPLVLTTVRALFMIINMLNDDHAPLAQLDRATAF